MAKKSGIKMCLTCGKQSDNFDLHSRICRKCHSDKNNLNYHRKMKETLFVQAERARRMEKYFRRRKEIFLSAMDEITNNTA